MTVRNYKEVLDRFRNLRVMVIGDVMVDAYLFGQVERISPEAPVPVVSVTRRISRLGGAANVALNLKALGAEPVLCSVIGKDSRGEEFLHLLGHEDLTGGGMIVSNRRITTTKFRVIGNNTQMLRVDEENTHDLEETDQRELLDKISEILESSLFHAIIFQDYNKGVLTSAVIEEVMAMAARKDIPVCVDPKRKNFLQFKGASLFKPNLKELREGLHRELSADDRQSLEEVADFFHKNQHVKVFMTTLSEKGVFISREWPEGKVEQHLIPACVRKIADVSGAGDTVIGVAALCLAAGVNAYGIAAISNLAGGLVCEEVGVVPVNREKLLHEVLSLV
jgi:D-glycero-beta-D-manno-heptose-7-phosphate kinase